MERSLAQGLGMSEAFLRSGQLKTMQTVALVPPETPSQVLSDPEQGGVTTRERALEILTAFVNERCANSQHCTLLVEDELLHSDDDYFRKTQFAAPVFVSGLDVYHWLHVRRDTSVREIASLLTEATSGYPTNMFLLTDASEQRVTGMNSLPSVIARDVDAVIVSAYDDEAFIAAITSR